MKEKIRNYLNENWELIREEMEYAAKESFDVSESGGNEEKVSVVLTNDFELETFKHPNSYWFPNYILHVLYSFECETYIVEYYDIRNFLTEEQATRFEKSLLEKAEELLQLENDKLEEFNELTTDEKLDEVLDYMYENYLVLELFEEFDHNLYEKYLKDIYDNSDTSYAVDFAMERMFDNLYEYEEYSQ